MSWYRSVSAEGLWEWRSDPSLNLGSSGPSRVETNEHDPDFKPRPVGFLADLGEAEPLVWDGDGA